ncbi:MAG TPA: hypothetical protein VD866_28385, partial [Urbifossiella sp.]|nr:hypothetical protein [Urbifossiella sp.]
MFRNDARGRLLAEVNWADLSRFPVSLFGLFEGLVGLLFGLRHVAAAASTGCGYRTAAVLRGLGRTVAFLLIGPLAASNVLMLFLLAGAVVAEVRENGSFAGPLGDFYSRIACGLAVVVGVWLGWRLRRIEVYRWLFRSLAVIALVVLAAALTLQAAGRANDIWGWGGMEALLRQLPPKPGEAAPPTEKSSGGVLFFVAVAVFPMAIAFVSATLASFAALVVYAVFLATRPDNHARRSALVAAMLPCAMVFGWCVLIPFAWVVSGALISAPSWLSADFKNVYHTLLEFLLARLPLVYMGLGLIVLAALLALFSWSRKKVVDNEDKRLIVASLVLAALAVITAVLTVVFVLGLFSVVTVFDELQGSINKTAL